MKRLTILLRARLVGLRLVGDFPEVEVAHEGWGDLCETFVRHACELSGQPELKGKITDILMAKSPTYEIVPKK